MSAHQLLAITCLTCWASFAHAQTFTVLHSFSGSDGSYPVGGVAFENNTLYGTTESGGNGTGTVFTIVKEAPGDFGESVVYNLSGTAGEGPSGNLLSVNGTLMGTAAEGGIGNAGTVFQITPGVNGAPATESTIYSFQSAPDGHGPYAGLTAGSSGILYGTTTYGGNTTCANKLGCGTVFQLTPPAVVGGAWTETVIYQFQEGTDGVNPSAAVTFASTGNLYGTTSAGGTLGAGAVFQLTPPAIAGNPWTESIIYSFQAGADGEEPLAALIIDRLGQLFGSTLGGGTSGCGTAFELAPPAVAGGIWTKTTIHSFTCTDGAYPEGAMLLKLNRSGYVLYGVASGGGSSNAGTIFGLYAPAAAGDPWTEITLHNFDPSTDGADPVAGLYPGANNGLVGTASTGGANDQGTVFRIVP